MLMFSLELKRFIFFISLCKRNFIVLSALKNYKIFIWKFLNKNVKCIVNLLNIINNETTPTIARLWQTFDTPKD